MNAEKEKWDCYKKLAELGETYAIMKIAKKSYYDDDDVPTAVYWYRQAAVRGIEAAMLKLAEISLNRKKDVDQAVRWFMEAYNHGCSYAGGAIVRIYYENEAYTDALTWIKTLLADDGDNGDVLYFLGRMYLGGYGVPQDYDKALSTLEKAAAFDNPAAIASLGFIYRDGLGVTVDKEKAIQYYQKACGHYYSSAYIPLRQLENPKPEIWIMEVVKDILAEQLGIDREDIHQSDSIFNDLGADSLDGVEIAMAAEEIFDTEIMDEEAESMDTVDDLYQNMLPKQREGKMVNEKVDINYLENIISYDRHKYDNCYD